LDLHVEKGFRTVDILLVIPAKAGIQVAIAKIKMDPAFAGMTRIRVLEGA
jgi:hypothetical protein